VFGVRPATSASTAPAVAGSDAVLSPYEAVVPYSKCAVVASFTVPVSVAVLAVTSVAGPVMAAATRSVARSMGLD
jgi:hypothetical protein